MSLKQSRTRLEQGQGLVEYVLMIMLVAIVVIIALNVLANGLANGLYQNILAAI